MRVVDTSAWIEWLLASRTGAALKRLLPATDQWVVPTIVQLELAKWLHRESSEDFADRTIALTNTLHVAPLDTRIALHAAELCAARKLATADAIVYATAMAHDADLLTCDAHFDGLDRVVFVGKRRE
ncbi:MAG: type II toxin-antitoxin system VapC family toxin [Parvularculaceae bacterium]